MQTPSLLVEAVGNASGLDSDRIQELAEYRCSLIRDLPQGKEAYGVIGAAINWVALRYGVRQEPERETLDECIRLVGAKFGDLSPREIKEAYRMWAADELPNIGSKGEMWGGQINARNLGAVLSAYWESRKNDMAAFLSAVSTKNEREEREQKIAEAKAAVEDKLHKELQQAVEEADGWRDMRAYWFKSLWTRNLLTLTEQQLREIAQEATRIAEEEVLKRKTDIKTLGRAFEEVADMENIAEAICFRMAVWRYYVKPRKRDNP